MAATLSKYYNAFVFSQEFLIRLNIRYFPLDPFALLPLIQEVYSLNILLTTDKEYAGFCIDTGNRHRSVKDGMCIWDTKNDVYLVIINDDLPKERQRFTLLHEIGHILLGHLNDDRTELERGGLGKSIYYYYEGEANVFAGNALVPPILLQRHLQDKFFFRLNAVLICQKFGISASASVNRQTDFREWLKKAPTAAELLLLKRCEGIFLIHRCNCCGYANKERNVRFCIICGRRFDRKPGKFIGKGAGYMIYPEVALDDFGRAKLCPVCKNEQYADGADYCHICGAHVRNTCTRMVEDYNNNWVEPCQESITNNLPGNARFCPYCGSKASFFENGILKSWEDENHGTAANKVSISTLNNEMLEDDMLPF